MMLSDALSPGERRCGIGGGVRIADVAECYEKHADGLLRFASTLVGPVDAEDVVSTAVVGVLNSDLERVRDLRSYLYQAVANGAKKHWRTIDRRARRERLLASVELHTDAEYSPDLLRSLARLSPQQRAVVHLTYWEDLTQRDVAERLDVGEGTVRRQLARARRRLREVLDEDR
jgi:RNA polymerase sigma-70 factor (ECF subfamily)